MASTAIEWTDETWNPVRGCSIVSKGCTNCYAMKQAHRFSGAGGKYEGLTKLTAGGPVWTGDVACVPEQLGVPLRWRKPRRVFVNSMGDLFHADVPFEFICKVIATCIQAKQHTFQILTKRPGRMLEWSRRHWRERTSWPASNVWLGVSVEDQATADERIPLLLETPAAVRFVSYEPAIGRVDFCETFGMWWNQTMGCFEGTGQQVNRRGREGKTKPGIDWVIVGGESGPGARPFDVAWARSTIEQCKAAGVPVFVKQLGSRPVGDWHGGGDGRCCMPKDWVHDRKGGDPSEWPEALRVRQFPEVGP